MVVVVVVVVVIALPGGYGRSTGRNIRLPRQ
jgi:hypothetical protein